MTTIATRGFGALGSTRYVLANPDEPAPGPPELVLGWPESLGVWYAGNPLATLVGLLATGVGVGYFIWGRNRSGGMGGLAGTPEEHSVEFDRLLWEARRSTTEGLQRLMLVRAQQEARWFRMTADQERKLEELWKAKR